MSSPQSTVLSEPAPVLSEPAPVLSEPVPVLEPESRPKKIAIKSGMIVF